MSTRRFRLTKAAKVMIFVLAIALIGGGAFAAVKTGFVKTDSKNASDLKVAATTTTTTSNKAVDVNNVDADGNVINTEKEANNTINISLDEWIG